MATDVISVIRADGLGDFTTLTAWEAAKNYDITLATGDDTRQIAEIFDATCVVSHPSVEFVGGVHDRTTNNYLLIRPFVGNEFNVITKSGGKLISAGFPSFISNTLVVRSGNKLDIEELGLFFTSTATSAYYPASIIINKSYIEVLRGIFNGATINNSIIYCNYPSANSTGEGGSINNAILNNVTIIVTLGSGAYSGDMANWSCTCTNVVVYNENTKTTYNSYYLPASITTCAQNNNGSAALPAGNINGILQTDFTNYAAGDYSLPLGSALINAGTDLSAQFTTDIVGTVRG